MPINSTKPVSRWETVQTIRMLMNKECPPAVGCPTLYRYINAAGIIPVIENRKSLFPVDKVFAEIRKMRLASPTNGELVFNSEEEMKKRLAEWRPPQKTLKGYLKRYAKLVQSASTGATFEE